MGSAKSKTACIILYTLGLGLLSGLSVWQYQRGLAKQAITEKLGDAKQMTIAAKPADWKELEYQSARVEGRWLSEKSLLLENRIYQGQVGFEVLTPFRLSADGVILLVNRGWIAEVTATALRAPSKSQSIQGVLYSPEQGVELGDAILPEILASHSWPKKSLYIDLPIFSTVLGLPLEATVLVLSGEDPSAFVRIWKAAVMPAEKHFGYAIQWLGLALTFMIYGVIWFRRRSR